MLLLLNSVHNESNVRVFSGKPLLTSTEKYWKITPAKKGKNKEKKCILGDFWNTIVALFWNYRITFDNLNFFQANLLTKELIMRKFVYNQPIDL